MSDFGLEVRNQSGDVLIDSTFRNFEVIAEGTVVHSGTGLTYTVSISFAATPNPPLVFARCTAAQVACYTLTKDGGGHYSSATLRSSDPFGTLGAFDIDWFVAAPADSVSADTWGLQVFDAAGDKCFDSGERYVQIADVVLVDPADFDNVSLYTADSGTAIPYAHASTAAAYYCLNALRAWVAPGADEVPPAVMHPGVRVASATQVNVAMLDQAITGNWSPDPYTRHTVPLIVATKPS